MGVTPLTYWLSFFSRDVSLYFVLVAVIYILVWAFSIIAMIGPAFLMLFFLILLFIPPMLVFIYVYSMAFDHYQTCQTVLPMTTNFLCIIPYMVVAGLDMGGFETPAKDFLYAFMVWNPAAAVASGIHFIAMVYYRAAIQDQVPDYADYFKIDNGVFPVLVVFIIEDVLIFLYLLYHAFRQRSIIIFLCFISFFEKCI